MDQVWDDLIDNADAHHAKVLLPMILYLAPLIKSKSSSTPASDITRKDNDGKHSESLESNTEHIYYRPRQAHSALNSMRLLRLLLFYNRPSQLQKNFNWAENHHLEYGLRLRQLGFLNPAKKLEARQAG